MYIEAPETFPDGSELTGVRTVIRQSFTPDNPNFGRPHVKTTCYVRLPDTHGERDMTPRWGSRKFRPKVLTFDLSYPHGTIEPTIQNVKTHGPRVLKTRLSDLEDLGYEWWDNDTLPEWVSRIITHTAVVLREPMKAAEQ